MRHEEETQNHRKFSEAFDSCINELKLSNIAISLQSGNFEVIKKAHNSIHRMALIWSKLIDNDKKFLAKSAFIIYFHEAFDSAHRSLLEALAGYYNPAYVLLRSTLELILKGSFWECMAHKKYRVSAKIIEKETRGLKIDGVKKTIVDWINDVIERDPSIEHQLEETSASIYDKISPIFEEASFQRMVPHVKSIIKQLGSWGIFDPIQNPAEVVYGLYKELSADVHVIPDKTCVGKRILAKKEPFETEIIDEELSKYAEKLRKVLDIGIVVELNMLEDLIAGVDDCWLKEEINVLKNLELNYAFAKMSGFIS